ncbi:biotin transporter BioY [Parasphaerochaeta coccoides]|uniref:Biotin transporter n=1 Tax=Parasphaerochaeta coccoides (strain ATCC BAA-1237 / DSM 17374 / SPN1) TaxID=760011 RepID=F4GJG5_PARC1|nr:ECF transporter S component [Parasphaerochaeta coccoides]AEC02230.1 BioY protein [Parasphaerochaeta coccoides DSM 17374]
MNSSRSVLVTALFAALIIVGAFLRIPLPPVPITLQTLMVLLAGLLLGWKLGLASVGIYLLLGLIGLPVFTTGGGYAAFFGPTGGFLVALLPAVTITGIGADAGWKHRDKNPWIFTASLILSSIMGTIVIYAIGVPWLKTSLGLSWQAALAGGMYPFLIGDTVKAIVAVMVALRLRERIMGILQRQTEIGDID